jgi:hypothetical protein
MQRISGGHPNLCNYAHRARAQPWAHPLAVKPCQGLEIDSMNFAGAASNCSLCESEQK